MLVGFIKAGSRWRIIEEREIYTQFIALSVAEVAIEDVYIAPDIVLTSDTHKT